MNIDLSKETKASLHSRLLQAEAEKTQMQTAANNLAAIANTFQGSLLNIEASLNKVPAVQSGFFKKVWWVLSNLNVIVSLIEEIISHISSWRAYTNELLASQKNAQQG